MMPRIVAKSGSVRRLETSPTRIVPMPMPASATPTGRPIASTEPKATMRMTMAKASPRISDDGSSNSAKAAPPTSSSTPGMSGAWAWMSSEILSVSSNEASSGASSCA
jgi:hypothetical protein